MKKIVLLLTLLLFVGCSSTSKLVSLPNLTFEINKSDNWMLFDTPHGLISLKPKENNNISFVIYQNKVINPDKFNLEAYIDKGLKKYNKKYKIIKKKKNSKKGESFEIVKTHYNEYVNYNVKTRETYFYKNNIVYVLVYGGNDKYFDKYINDVNQMVKSFKVKE